MKNLKDEIGGKQNYKRGEPFNGEVVGILLALLNTHSSEDEQSEGVGKLALWEAIEAITSLIEQEKERAVEELHNFVRSNTLGGRFMDDGGGYFNADAVLREDIEQYLAERKGE